MNDAQIEAGKQVLRLIDDLNNALGEAIRCGLVINLAAEDRPKYTPKTPIITANVLAPITLEDQ